MTPPAPSEPGTSSTSKSKSTTPFGHDNTTPFSSANSGESRASLSSSCAHSAKKETMGVISAIENNLEGLTDRLSNEPLPAAIFRRNCLQLSQNSASKVMPHQVFSIEISGSPDTNFPIQKNRRRCWECKARIGLTAVTCHCGFKFCNLHRYAEEHNCTFNFKLATKRKLTSENPRVVPAKVARII
ncbi:unnamed protein product [Albugo candida]|uniref:AN1-type domain-containing protein n=1 Tax=Albugo candida TaxID=65357 RepID=A0A024GUC8_9STRA|nr:unnamed protein product [Albugo candida]|eukprot:CCI49933.1 unnamed protein product [Albugo candida]